MALTHDPILLGTAADSGDGDTIRQGGTRINTNTGNLISAVNNLLTLLGAGTEVTVDLGTFTGAVIGDNVTVKAAIQALETALEAANVLDPGYVAGAAVVPVAGDTLEQAIAKLHGLLSSIDQAIILKGDWDASVGTFPAATNAGWSYIVSVAGTVGGIPFDLGDRLISLLDNASTTVYAANWFKADGSDLVTSVFGRQGAVVALAGDYTATQITNTPAGDVAAVTVQAAIDELDGDKLAKALLSSKGSIITRDVTAPVELGVGVDGAAIIADSSTSSGLRYSAQLEVRLSQADIPTTATLTAATSVDVANYIAFTQTTVNGTVTIPSPTIATKHRTVTLENVGTATLGVLFASGTGFYLNPNEAIHITWNGSRWVSDANRLAVKGESGIIELGGTYTLTSPYAQVTGMAVTLPSAGKYMLTAQVCHQFDHVAPPSLARLFDVTANTNINGSEIKLGKTNAVEIIQGMGTISVLYTVTQPSVIHLQAQGQNNGNNLIVAGGSGNTSLSFVKVDGFAPVLGTTVDTLTASATALSPANNTPTNVGGTLQTGNIAYTPATGAMALKAGKTYRLTATLQGNTNGDVNGGMNYWFSTTSAGAQGTAINGAVAFIGALTHSSALLNSGVVDTTFTPTTDTIVYLVVTMSSSSQRNLLTGMVNVQQIGSTAATELTLRNHEDLIFVTANNLAASATQHRCCPFQVTSLAQANAAAAYLIQRYSQLINGTENDSHADSMLGDSAIILASTMAAVDSRYASVTFAMNDVDPAITTNPFAEWYEMAVGYDPITGTGYYIAIMHNVPTDPGTGGGPVISSQTYWTVNGSAGATALAQAAPVCYTRPANSAVAYASNPALLVPMWFRLPKTV